MVTGRFDPSPGHDRQDHHPLPTVRQPMDPNETLRAIRDLARLILESDQDQSHRAEELAEAVDALDTWLGRGGFLPDAWATPDRA